ncbi:amidase [Mesorhizobium sp. M2D.F.Ca.ET.223.01.1.1]|uniref:amidase n=1 Tax=unclassified Mesorhizobium TaxID=325217 RepID=UPI000FCBA409|nr:MULTISPECIES: amidase [unclassified Mesorhizobium]TGQ00832.1 amidase [bacterium M00.F.Ca.ET.221.01.1.1]TGQ02647.1 amidase [bacterium M00.F.Ca.ET.222.01.1.1]TGV72259.1 amidase [Mesorhizobium sp. M2D.F.Ca.ET.160.01.1.1]RVD61646.1 amidase [Mesorhizobium sp. M2D.F.Ca.ET.140.01.1.1]TGP20882.1 amidase [Mesorhizobium sp. M2D.F.Ca.ET.233.01.1.1]
MTLLHLVEASIADLRLALEGGTVTSVELVAAYLRRIAHFDRHGIALNAVPVLNPKMFEEAEASDRRRRAGKTLGPLDGIPYTAKDSYKVKGLTVAAGSPAFEHLTANEDAFTIARLRAAGAVLIGLTNMPPMANGGMQRGVYGRAESPYNKDFLTAAFGSGSSNGSGTATAASFAAFGLGEETWSSGRAPASNNALVAYTPSRGVISARGNWPLVPTMDVVVPHTRSIPDMLELLDIIVADDREARGDFWRVQPWVEIPKASALRPASYTGLSLQGALEGKRLGVPKMYIGKDSEAERPIETRASVLELWQQAARDLEALGAEVVEVDFPVVSNYERDRPGALSMVDRGLVPPDFADREIWELSIWSWDDFLRANADPAIPDLASVDGKKIFPQPPGALPDRFGDADFDLAHYVERARRGVAPLAEIPAIEAGLKGLEATRRIDFEAWLDANGLDAVVLPAVADVGPADADVNEASAVLAWRNGTWVANGNLVWRHLGIPTVTVPLGTMADIGMPVGLTFAGKAYDDVALLSLAGDYERATKRRTVPTRTPALADDVFEGRAGSAGDAPLSFTLSAETTRSGGTDEIAITLDVDAKEPATVKVHVNGEPVLMRAKGCRHTGRVVVPASTHQGFHSVWRGAYGSIVTAIVRSADGRTAGAYVVTGGIG